MPLLGPDDPLPRRPRRVLVTGTSGAGKTTLAGRIAAVLDVPYVEIDALFHGPGWTPRPDFERQVHALAARPGWVTEWQYRSVRAHLLRRADLLVWLDLPRARVMAQVVRRTVVRRLRRQELWNGNREPPLWSILRDREHIVRWAWTTHHKTAARVADRLRADPDLTVVRLASHRQARRWLDGRCATWATRAAPDARAGTESTTRGAGPSALSSAPRLARMGSTECRRAWVGRRPPEAEEELVMRRWSGPLGRAAGVVILAAAARSRWQWSRRRSRIHAPTVVPCSSNNR